MMKYHVPLLLVMFIFAGCVPGPTVRVGSKLFTESVILGDVLAVAAESAGYRAEHRRELGGSTVLFRALEAGSIDAYVEYSGTLLGELLAAERLETLEAARPLLAERGIGIGASLGFHNGYAIGLRREVAEELGLRKVSDLPAHPGLRLGFSDEFLNRDDGWPGLARAYNLPQSPPRGMDHMLAIRAVAEGRLDATDLYTTDAEIRQFDLVALEDDLDYWPEYVAVVLYRLDLENRAPGFVRAIESLAGTIDEETMVEANARAAVGGENESVVAADLARRLLGIDAANATIDGRARRIVRYTVEHLALVATAMVSGTLVAVPLGVLAAGSARAGRVILPAVDVLQTIPSLALLAFMIAIPGLGIGFRPAAAALFLYSLLPIVRGTHVGITSIPVPLKESARALGLSLKVRLLHVELPLAMPAILNGVKTSTVITIGFATLGAFIGAGGYGTPILTGLRRADNTQILLEGALPAATMAVAAGLVLSVVQRRLVSPGLRG